MEHIFNLLVICAVLVGAIVLFSIADFAVWLFGKLFPKLEDKIIDFFCR